MVCIGGGTARTHVGFLLGHNYALSARAEGQLRAASGALRLTLLADYARGRVDGFYCLRCGMPLQEIVQALAYGKLSAGLGMLCTFRRGARLAASRGATGQVMYDALGPVVRDTPVEREIRDALATLLEHEIGLLGGVPRYVEL